MADTQRRQITSRKFDYIPWIITLIAILIRLLYLNQIAVNNPYFYNESLVAEVHHNWALAIVKGQTAYTDAFIRAPLYPYLIAAIYWIAGSNILYPRLLQLLIGGLLTLGIFSAGKRLFGRKSAITAAIIWAIYGPMIFFEGELFETSLTTALIFTIYLVWQKAVDMKSTVLFGLTGLLIGIATLMKPNSAFFLPILLLWFLVEYGRSYGGWKSVLIMTVGFVVVILPVTIRNYSVSGEFVPVAAYGGLNIYLGANPQSDGVSAILPEITETERDEQWGRKHFATALTAASIRLASEEAGRDLTPAQASRYWYGKAAEFALKHPLKYIIMNAKKLLLFFSGFEFANTKDLYFSREHSWLLSILLWNEGIKFPLGLLIPFAGLGIFYAYRDKIPNSKNLIVFLLGSVFSVILVFVCARFRMTAIPFLVIFAGMGAVKAFQGLNGKRVIINMLLFLPLLLITNADFFKMHKDTAYQEYHNLGQFYLEKGEYQKAYDSLMKSWRAKPDYRPTLNDLGLLLESFGKYPQAIYYYRESLKLKPDDSVALYNLGAAEGKGGALDSAQLHLKQALELNPHFWQALLNLGNTYMYRGDVDSAVVYYMKAAEISPENPDILFNLGNYYLFRGDTSRAIQQFLRTKQLNPNYPTVDNLLEHLNSSGGR